MVLEELLYCLEIKSVRVISLCRVKIALIANKKALAEHFSFYYNCLSQ